MSCTHSTQTLPKTTTVPKIKTKKVPRWVYLNKTKAEVLFSAALIKTLSAHLKDQTQALMQQTMMPFVLPQLLEMKS